MYLSLEFQNFLSLEISLFYQFTSLAIYDFPSQVLLELKIHTYLTYLYYCEVASLDWFQFWMYVLRSGIHFPYYYQSDLTISGIFLIWEGLQTLVPLVSSLRMLSLIHILQHFHHFVIRLPVLCLYIFWSRLFMSYLTFLCLKKVVCQI